MKAMFFIGVISTGAVLYAANAHAGDAGTNACPTLSTDTILATFDSLDVFKVNPHYCIYYDWSKSRRQYTEVAMRQDAQKMELDVGFHSFKIREGDLDVSTDPMDTAAAKNLRQELSRRVMLTDTVYVSRNEGFGAYLGKDATVSINASANSFKIKLSTSF
jgi:hypothetical protein